MGEHEERFGDELDPDSVSVDEAADSEDAEADSEEEPRHWFKRLLLWLRETTFILAMALVMSVLLRTLVFQAFFVPSESMEQTFLRDDRILVSKLSYRFTEINRGDIIVFRDPGNWLGEPIKPTGLSAKLADVLTFLGVLPANSGEDLVKRVIGLPGDKVRCCSPEGRIIVNGIALDESEYAIGKSTGVPFEEFVVPAGRYFVMGDNREFSSDSRFHMEDHFGTVPEENVVGQVVALVWPLNRYTTMVWPEVWATVPDPS